MLILFLISLAVLFYIFIGYPVVLAVLSGLIEKTVRREEITPEVSHIISAYNEQDVIREKLENTLALDYPARSFYSTAKVMGTAWGKNR